jgi:elongator complex protein 1
MTIGWGAKETQFQGSAGKQAAQIVIDDNESVDIVDVSVTISWRGDGQYFAVASMNDVDRRRTIRVWSRSGVHSSTCQFVPGLESTLGWR